MGRTGWTVEGTYTSINQGSSHRTKSNLPTEGSTGEVCPVSDMGTTLSTAPTLRRSCGSLRVDLRPPPRCCWMYRVSVAISGRRTTWVLDEIDVGPLGLNAVAGRVSVRRKGEKVPQYGDVSDEMCREKKMSTNENVSLESLRHWILYNQTRPCGGMISSGNFPSLRV